MKKKTQKNKSIKLNYIYNVSYQILTLITPLITAPYLSRVLKADGIGAYSYTYSLVSYFIMFAALGTVNYGNREISYLQEDRAKRTKTFWEIELLSVISVIVCLCAYMVFTLAFPHPPLKKHLLLIEAVYLISVASDISWLFQGLEEFGKIVGRNVIFKIINIAFIFIAVRSESDLLIYVAGVCLLELFANISIWFYLPQYVDRPKLKELKPFSHLRATLTLFVPTIATTIYTALDKTMLNNITGSMTENGYYEQANKISKMVLMLVTSLGTVMLPRIGIAFSENKKDEVKARIRCRGPAAKSSENGKCGSPGKGRKGGSVIRRNRTQKPCPAQKLRKIAESPERNTWLRKQHRTVLSVADRNTPLRHGRTNIFTAYGRIRR